MLPANRVGLDVQAVQPNITTPESFPLQSLDRSCLIHSAVGEGTSHELGSAFAPSTLNCGNGLKPG